jgi:predicted TIM-barrel fold metal-dependent hydrolase
MQAVAPIDCDVHPSVPNLAALMPYLDEVWRDTVIRRGIDELNTISYPSRSPLTARADWRDDAGKAATTPQVLAAQGLAPFGTRLAICNCLYGAQSLFSEDMGAAFACAINDWIAREWLDRDDRLRASIIVPMQNPELAVDEIERVAPDRRFVQVLLLAGAEQALGKRHWWPIYAAAERHGLPVGIHAGSTYRHPVTPVGWPSYYTEDYVNQAPAIQTQLTSIVAEGVFTRHPKLTVVLMESGVTWQPAYLWRLTKFWKGLRSEIPWVSDPPSSIVRDRVRLTLQPFDGPPARRGGDAGDGAYRLGRGAAVLHRLPALAVRRAGRHPGGTRPRARAEDHGGEPAAHLSSAATDNRTKSRRRPAGDRGMNVDVLNRSSVQAGGRFQSGHRRL